MINPIPFDVGKRWNYAKARVFDLLFNELHISYHWANPRDIGFLSKLKNLRGLVIQSTKSFDLSPLEDCKRLTYLNIACGVSRDTKVNLALIPLKTYLGRDNPKLVSVYRNKTVRRITVSGYHYEDLTPFQGSNIEHITIDGSKTLTSLKGIELLGVLKLVEIENCPNISRPTLHTNDYPFLRIYINGVLQK